MAAGFRSLLGFWAGGAGSPSATQAGYQSLLGFWAGGAGGETTQAGFRSLLGFWLGGASATIAAPEPPSGGGFFVPMPFHKRPIDDEEAIMLLIAAALHVIS